MFHSSRQRLSEESHLLEDLKCDKSFIFAVNKSENCNIFIYMILMFNFYYAPTSLFSKAIFFDYEEHRAISSAVNAFSEKLSVLFCLDFSWHQYTSSCIFV